MFSKIELSSEYHEVRIKEEDIYKTTFQIKYGIMSLLYLHSV